MKTRIVVNPDFSNYEQFVCSLPDAFERTGNLLFAKRNVVKRFDMADGTPLVVKRFRRPNLVQRLACTLYHPSKARKAYLNAAEFLRRGIDTPHPVAYIEQSRHGFFHQAYFVSTLNTSPDCRSLLDMQQAEWASMADSFAAFLIHLHRQGILHGDTNLTNFLYHSSADGTYDFSVIDTNRTHFLPRLPQGDGYAQPTQHQCLLNLMRLTHNEPVLKALVARYAALRGWDADVVVAQTLLLLHRFQQRNDLKHTFKHLRRWLKNK